MTDVAGSIISVVRVLVWRIHIFLKIVEALRHPQMAASVLSQAFLDDFPQFSPTQGWRNLEFLRKFLGFFQKVLEVVRKNGRFFPKFPDFH